MVEVFKLVRNYYYDSESATKLNCNTFSLTIEDTNSNYRSFHVIMVITIMRNIHFVHELLTSGTAKFPDTAFEADSINSLKIDWIATGLIKMLFLTLTLN